LKAGDAIMSALAGAGWWNQGQITALGNERGVRAMSLTQLLFSFQGRLNRKPYWTMAITTTVVFILLLLLAVVTLREYGLEFLLVTIAILVILYIPLIWIGLALGAKRLHDRDKSAWWLLVFYALPTILSTVADRMEDAQFIVLHIVSFGISVWAFVEIGCLRGTVGPNRYGPDPLSVPA
jgi:uncharacterized membrane protein YhaH (DUF805 family)